MISADPCSARGHKAVGATVSHLPLPTLPAGGPKSALTRAYTRLHALTRPYTRLLVAPTPEPHSLVPFCATSTKIRHLGAPNLERHATWATDGALFCSTSTGIHDFGAPKSLNLHDVNEDSPPRRFKICSCASRRLARRPFFRRRQRRFEHGQQIAPKRSKMQTS